MPLLNRFVGVEGAPGRGVPRHSTSGPAGGALGVRGRCSGPGDLPQTRCPHLWKTGTRQTALYSPDGTALSPTTCPPKKGDVAQKPPPPSDSAFMATPPRNTVSDGPGQGASTTSFN